MTGKLTMQLESMNDWVSRYENNREWNHRIWESLSLRTNEIPFLKAHRDHVEINKLGFGDRAFHSMWYLLLSQIFKEKNRPNFLEIGVYKGQVISLWSLIAKELNMDIDVFAISPLSGNQSVSRIINNKLIGKLRSLFDAEFRFQQNKGNSYANVNYEEIIRSLFNEFNLDYNRVKMVRGLSHEQSVKDRVKNIKFDLIYIDGDHGYEAVLSDIEYYTPLIAAGGYLVMDDASYFLEGDVYFKGHKEVSLACSGLEGRGFSNVLNVGHNRIYKKI